MKIDHGGRQTYMSEAFLYFKDTFTIFQEVRSCRVAKSMNRNRTVETCPCQCILEYGADIAGSDGTIWHYFTTGHEYEVITGIPFPEDA